MLNAGYVMCFVDSIAHGQLRSKCTSPSQACGRMWQNICQVQIYYDTKFTEIIYGVLCAEYNLGCFNVPIAMTTKSGG